MGGLNLLAACLICKAALVLHESILREALTMSACCIVLGCIALVPSPCASTVCNNRPLSLVEAQKVIPRTSLRQGDSLGTELKAQFSVWPWWETSNVSVLTATVSACKQIGAQAQLAAVNST